MGRLLWPELEPEAVQTGFIVEIPPMQSHDILAAIARRHPMDGWGVIRSLRDSLARDLATLEPSDNSPDSVQDLVVSEPPYVPTPESRNTVDESSS